MTTLTAREKRASLKAKWERRRARAAAAEEARRERVTIHRPLHEFKEFELNVTQRCNAVCDFCDRLVGVIKIPDTDVTPQQVEKMFDAFEQSEYRPRRIALAGGEPMVNKHLPEIMQVIKRRMQPRPRMQVLTNAVKPLSLALKRLPDNVRYHTKSAPLSEKNHVPFLVSPADNGMEPRRTLCAIQHKCGLAFDAFGFSMCPVATSLAHVLNINPYHDRPTADRDMDICRHCPHSIRRDARMDLYEKIRTKQIPYPSPTLAAGLKRYKAAAESSQPIKFPRFGE